jgi:hypothetical protein
MTTFWDVAPSSLIEVDSCFRGWYSLYHQDDEGDSMQPWNVSLLWNYMALHPESCHLHTCHCKNLKFHIVMYSTHACNDNASNSRAVLTCAFQQSAWTRHWKAVKYLRNANKHLYYASTYIKNICLHNKQVLHAAFWKQCTKTRDCSLFHVSLN